MSGDDRQNSPSISRQNRPSATLTFCADLKKKVQTVRDNGGVLTNETDDTTQKAEQESAKEATCEAAR